MAELEFNCKFCGEKVETNDFNDITKNGFCNIRCYQNKQEIIITELGANDVGFKNERIHHNEREKAFSYEWMRENKHRPGINFGYGTLQDLFITRERMSNTFHFEIKSEHRYVVATVIQWLGTNCGMAFIEKVLDKFGKVIVSKKLDKGFVKITDDNLPDEGVEVIGFTREWIDEDYNPRGTRVCFLDGDGNWCSSKWNNTHDVYNTIYSYDDDDIVPTHYMKIPNTVYLK